MNMNEIMQELSRDDRIGLKHEYDETREVMHKINALLFAVARQVGPSPLIFRGKPVHELQSEGHWSAGSICAFSDGELMEDSRICGTIDLQKIEEIYGMIESCFIDGVWTGNSISYGCCVECRYIKRRGEGDMQAQRNALRVETMVSEYDLFCGARLKPGRIGGHYDDYLRCCVDGYRYAAYRHSQFQPRS